MSKYTQDYFFMLKKSIKAFKIKVLKLDFS